MTKYTYQTATGPVEIDVDPYWAKILKAEDALEERNHRKYARPDHKYAPCAPLSLESLYCEGKWFEDHDDAISAAELSLDLERALAALTDPQRRYFVMTRLEGYSYAEIARREGRHLTTVRGIVEVAEKKVREYFR
jgi:RNA polymerase sigma factor (sigma-70 family)